MNNQSQAGFASEYSDREFGEQENENLLHALHQAIENNELSVEYQPRYDTVTGHTNTFEALVRWHRKHVGTVYPGEFIDKAVSNGLIFSLDMWVFEKCCSDLVGLRADVDKYVKIAVNISPLECESLDHMQKLLFISQKYGLQLSDFEFEIIESSQISNLRKVKMFCDTVIEHGATISLDDFGTCFSPLNNLCELPINSIKIDCSFTNKIGYGGRSDILIEHLISLAHEMDMKIVAEGIEHAYQRDRLVNMGCDKLQGFFMCKPLNPENIALAYINM